MTDWFDRFDPDDPWRIDPSELEPGDSPWRYDLTAAMENGYSIEEIEDAFTAFSDAVAEWDEAGRPGMPPDEMYDWFVEILDYFTPEEWAEMYG